MVLRAIDSFPSLILRFVQGTEFKFTMTELINLGVKRFNIFKLSAFIPSSTISRNTYILKRRHQPRLKKILSERHKILKGKHFIYELVEDTDETEPPDLRLVLTTFVEGIGDIGDVISVEPHYGRNHLLLPRYAIYATPENIEHFARMKKDRPEQPKYSSIYAGMVIRYLERKVVPIFMNSENNWTIEPWHIQTFMSAKGIVVPEHAIKLPDKPIIGPDSAKEGKDFGVFVTINNTETVCVRCRLFHIKAIAEIEKINKDCYLGKEDPILEEQRELLNNLPLPELDDESESNVSLKEKYRINLIQ